MHPARAVEVKAGRFKMMTGTISRISTLKFVLVGSRRQLHLFVLRV
jgi:hypothetical protein